MWCKRPTTWWCLAILAVGGLLAGCTAREHQPVKESPKSFQYQERPSTQPSVRQGHAAPEDMQAFQDAMETIGRLDYPAAERELRRLLVRFEACDDRRYLTETMFWLGYCLEKQSVFDEARGYYQRLLEKYADTPAARSARRRLAGLPKE